MFSFWVIALHSYSQSANKAEQVVRSFLNHLDNRDFDKAYGLTTNPSWGSYERFSSTDGFGGIERVNIDTTIVLTGIPKSAESLVFAEYYAYDPANSSGRYRFDFHVNDKLKIVKATPHHFDKLATVGVYNSEEKVTSTVGKVAGDIVYEINYDHFINPTLINTAINEALINISYPDNVNLSSIEDLNSRYVEEGLEFVKEMLIEIDEMGNTYRECKESYGLLAQLGDYVTFYNIHYMYLGGAHGMYGSDYITYDLISKEIVDYRDIIDLEKKEGLDKLIFQALWEDSQKRGLQYDNYEQMTKIKASATELEYASVAIAPNGVIINYKPYAIGSFAEGEHTILLSWEKAAPYLKHQLKKTLKL